VSSLALTVATGPDNVVDSALHQADTGIPFSVLSNLYGGWAAGLANLLLITSIFGALLSFHNTVARYVFAMSRERVLPPWLGRIGTGSAGGAPIGGSLLQSVIALLVFGAFAITGADPVFTLFTWLSYVAAVGILLLLVGTSLAVIGYFRRNPQATETMWRRQVAPVLGAIALTLVLGVTVWNSGSILGTASFSALTIVLPAIIALAAVVGVVWGMVLRESRPAVYEAIGAGQTKPLAVLSHAFSDADV
jgi:amino acid transporter